MNTTPAEKIQNILPPTVLNLLYSVLHYYYVILLCITSEVKYLQNFWKILIFSNNHLWHCDNLEIHNTPMHGVNTKNIAT